MVEKFAHRSFKLWEYVITFQQLLIRSQKTINEPTNVDIVFFATSYIEIPTGEGLFKLLRPTLEECNRAKFVLAKKVESESIFILERDLKRFMVVAVSYKVIEDERDFWDSPLQTFRMGQK